MLGDRTGEFEVQKTDGANHLFVILKIFVAVKLPKEEAFYMFLDVECSRGSIAVCLF